MHVSHSLPRSSKVGCSPIERPALQFIYPMGTQWMAHEESPQVPDQDVCPGSRLTLMWKEHDWQGPLKSHLED